MPETDVLRFVVVSHRAASMAVIVPRSRYVVKTVADPVPAALAILQKAGRARCHFLFVVEMEDLPSIRESLSGLGDRINFAGLTFYRGDNAHGLVARFPFLQHAASGPLTHEEFAFQAELAFRRMEGASVREREAIDLRDVLNDQEALIRIGQSLSLEKDPDRLLRTILILAKKITGADAGSIFIVEGDAIDPDRKMLRFAYSHTYSIDADFESFIMPLDTRSIAGYVAETGEVLNLNDVYRLPAGATYGFNPSYDKETGYRTKSMLVVPMRGNGDRIIGVIELINCKEGAGEYSGNEAFEIRLDTEDDFISKVVPFPERYEAMMEAIAGQAAIAMENTRMLRQIEFQFESFVKASVSAVESRDPSTAGHSFRIAALSVALAEAVSESGGEPWNDVLFTPTQLTELEFAGLLHDFGKVYIEPRVFLKAKKLFPAEMDLLDMRHSLIKSNYVLEGVRGVRPEADNLVGYVDEASTAVRDLNEPTPLSDESKERILRLEELCSLVDSDYPLLTDPEWESLRVPKGSLTPAERREIEGHVEHTFEFVSHIPWPREYANIPDICRCHHEFLDGSGYPRGLVGEDIRLESRIMAIADIFDALSAADRPYKKAIPLARVKVILSGMAEEGKLDADLLHVFLENRVWEHVPSVTERLDTGE